MPFVPLRRALLVAATLCCPALALAQGPTATLAIDGPGSQWADGVLRCAVGNEVQLSIHGLDAAGNRSILEKERPVARSSDPRIASAVVPEYSAYILSVVCRGDGQARVQVTAGAATTTFAAMVGSARDAAPAPLASRTGTTTRDTAPAAGSAPVAVVGTATPQLVTATAVRQPASEVTVVASPLVAKGVAWPAAEVRITTSPLAAEGPAWPAAEVRITAATLQASGTWLKEMTTAPRTIKH